VERLDIEAYDDLSECFDKPGTVGWWLELFSLFGAVRMLLVIGYLVPFATYALMQPSNTGSGAVFPFLRDLHITDLESFAPQLESFLAVRRRSSRVISIHDMREEGYIPINWPPYGHPS
jgi:hypothetical protein